RELTARHGTLLVFDEVITGFRLALGGAHQHYGVTPDMTTLGKILGGGFPIGALCGRRDVFERLDHRRAAKGTRVFQGGTFTGNPISLVAGLETMKALQDAAVYAHLDALGARMRSGLAAAFADAGIPAAITGIGSTVGVHFRSGGPPRNAREAADDDAQMGMKYFEHMRGRGIAYLTPDLPHMFISAAHTEGDIDAFMEATREFAARRAAENRRG
ncbi:MAG: aminotransferase class III-fold pyridoxal phosphate-dependent enzyme, partial [Bacteroidales bacterium]